MIEVIWIIVKSVDYRVSKKRLGWPLHLTIVLRKHRENIGG